MRIIVLALSLFLNFLLYAAGSDLAGWNSLQIMAVLAVLNFLAILIHELGHAWAFRHVGGSVSRIVVLFLSYDVKRRRVGRSRLPASGDVGGYVAGNFRAEGPTVRDQIIVSGAGPVANLVTGVIALSIALLWPPVSPAASIFRDYDALEAARFDAVEAGEIPSVRNPAHLPTEEEISAALNRVDGANRRFAVNQITHAGMTLFAVLSIGLGLLNLLPYGGSDGQHIRQALKVRRMARRR